MVLRGLTSHPCQSPAPSTQFWSIYGFFNRYTKRQSKFANRHAINDLIFSNRYKFSIFQRPLFVTSTNFCSPFQAPSSCLPAIPLRFLASLPPCSLASSRRLSQPPSSSKLTPLSMPKRLQSNLPGPTDRRIDALLALLAENSTIVISGAKIAKEIGVKRQTVWTWVQKLREAGVKVNGHPRTGYHIERAPDVLAPQLLAHRLRGTPFEKRIFHYFKTDSTNTVAIRMAEAGELHGAVVIAEQQTAGRGRAGRSWVSEKSAGIHVTVLLRPRISPMFAPALTLAAGLASRDAIAEEAGLTPDIRWPNDVLLHGRKVCGILTEMQAEPDRVHFAVVGIGINVNQQKLPPELAGIATSLRIETGRLHSRLDLLARLLRSLDRYYNEFITGGTAPILRRFSEVSSFFQGKRVRITTINDSFTGTTDGLETTGILRVRRDDGRIEPVVSGDVAEAE